MKSVNCKNLAIYERYLKRKHEILAPLKKNFSINVSITTYTNKVFS